MPATDTQIVQATGNLHHDVRDPLGGQPQDIFDNPTPFDASNDVFDDHTHARKDAIEKLLTDTQVAALGLFLGCRVNTPAGS
jgi:hypothetical protein